MRMDAPHCPNFHTYFISNKSSSGMAGVARRRIQTHLKGLYLSLTINISIFGAYSQLQPDVGGLRCWLHINVSRSSTVSRFWCKGSNMGGGVQAWGKQKRCFHDVSVYLSESLTDVASVWYLRIDFKKNKAKSWAHDEEQKSHHFCVQTLKRIRFFFFFAAKVPISTWLISSASAGNPNTGLPQGRATEAGGGSASGVSLGWSDMTVGETLM